MGARSAVAALVIDNGTGMIKVAIWPVGDLALSVDVQL